MNASLLLALLLVGLAASLPTAPVAVEGEAEIDTTGIAVKDPVAVAKPSVPAVAAGPLPVVDPSVATGKATAEAKGKKEKKEKKDSSSSEEASDNKKKQGKESKKEEAKKEEAKKGKGSGEKKEGKKGEAVVKADKSQAQASAQAPKRRDRRSSNVNQLALLAALDSSSEESGSCCDEEGKANTHNRMMDQVNLMLAKLQNCGNNKNQGYPYWGYPYYYNYPYYNCPIYY